MCRATSKFGAETGVGARPLVAHARGVWLRQWLCWTRWCAVALSLLTYGAVMSSHGRVGLEDSLYLGAGEKAKSNAEQVRKIRRIPEELGIEVAAPDEARQLLWLEGTR